MIGWFVELYGKSGTVPLSYDRHLHYIDSEALGIPRHRRANWINVIRDPMERIVSLYYYLTSSNKSVVASIVVVRIFYK